MLSNKERAKRAQRIELGLGRLDVPEQLQVLIAAMERVVRRAGMAGKLNYPAGLVDPSKLLLRRGKRSKIESDPEVKAFIDKLPQAMPHQAVADLCARTFGKGRAPSKSGVHRYRQRQRLTAIFSNEEALQ